MKRLEIDQQSPEWHELRRNKIGASDCPIIMGISPWKTPYALSQEKLGGNTYLANAAMKRGIELEEEARACFCLHTGMKFTPCVGVHENGWQMASFDGIDSSGQTILEIKCNGKEAHEKAKMGEIPNYYVAQIQHQLHVSGASKAFYFSYVSHDDFKIIEVFPDCELISDIIKKEEEFYDHVIIDNKLFGEPDCTELKGMYPSGLVEDLKNIKENMINLEKKEKEIKDILVGLCNGKNAKCGPLVITRVTKEGNVDYTKVPELFGVDLSIYRKPSSEYWKFTLKAE